jgi:hypothetical protein
MSRRWTAGVGVAGGQGLQVTPFDPAGSGSIAHQLSRKEVIVTRTLGEPEECPGDGSVDDEIDE